jgi:hypothetical protein
MRFGFQNPFAPGVPPGAGVRRHERPVARVMRGAGVILGCLLFPVVFVSSLPAGNVSKEYQVKAAFLYNFTKFVEWPAHCFSSPESPIVIGVVGADPFEGELAKIVRDRRVNGRPVSVVALRSPAEGRLVHVLFVPAGSDKRGATAQAGLAGVLTVGETEGFAAAAGIVGFTTVEQKVRFEINAAVAEAAGLKISAQLMKLAAGSRRTTEGPP